MPLNKETITILKRSFFWFLLLVLGNDPLEMGRVELGFEWLKLDCFSTNGVTQGHDAIIEYYWLPHYSKKNWSFNLHIYIRCVWMCQYYIIEKCSFPNYQEFTLSLSLSLSLYIYIYIYIYVCVCVCVCVCVWVCRWGVVVCVCSSGILRKKYS